MLFEQCTFAAIEGVDVVDVEAAILGRDQQAWQLLHAETQTTR